MRHRYSLDFEPRETAINVNDQYYIDKASTIPLGMIYCTKHSKEPIGLLERRPSINKFLIDILLEIRRRSRTFTRHFW